jgi:hypothetical protein
MAACLEVMELRAETVNSFANNGLLETLDWVLLDTISVAMSDKIQASEH